MSDIVEIDTGDEMTARIVAVWEAVARAGDDLKGAVEQLPAEDERARLQRPRRGPAGQMTRGPRAR